MSAPHAVTADAPRARVAPWVQLLWAAAAFVSSLCGIGGGLFAVPLLHYLGGLPLKRAVATSLCLVLTLSLTATAVEGLHVASGLRGEVVACLILGGWLGARAGLRVAERIDVKLLKRLFVVVLLFAAARIFMLDALVDTSAGSGVSLGPLTACVVVAVGMGAGFIAPLLGVGGGVIAIPALFLSLPSITYLEARACSMAMTIFVSGQSVHAYWKRGEINLPRAGGLIVGTLVGALAGVFAVHLEGWAALARNAMAVVLLLVAVRFAVDLLQTRRA